MDLEIKVVTLNVSDVLDASSVIEEAEKLGPVGGIFNLAVQLSDAMFENQSSDTFAQVASAKISGTKKPGLYLERKVS